MQKWEYLFVTLPHIGDEYPLLRKWRKNRLVESSTLGDSYKAG